MASRALPDLIARIRLDSSGVDEAVSNLTGSFGKANLAMAGLAAGLGLIVVGAKSMIDISIANEAAQADLKQAVDATGGSLDVVQGFLQSFIATNQRFLPSQSAVIESFAVLTRSGIQRKEAERDLNIALDLSALKHISLREAVDLVNKAEHGRFRGLVDLGVVSKDMIDANGNLIEGSHGVAGAMDSLEHSTANGRNTISDLDQKSNDLRGHWETLSNKTGPGLVGILDGIVSKANDWYNALDKIGKDDALWKRINDRLTTVAEKAGKVNRAIASWGDKNPWLDPNYDVSAAIDWLMNGPIGSAGGRRAAGGPVLPNSIYTVGEKGPETLVMGSQGGMVIPNSGDGGRTIHFTQNVYGSVMQERELALTIRETIRRLEREQK